jgi:hypothetical protein
MRVQRRYSTTRVETPHVVEEGEGEEEHHEESPEKSQEWTRGPLGSLAGTPEAMTEEDQSLKSY